MDIFGKRLAAARKMAGLSLQALADKLDGAVGRQALHKYEQNAALPNSKVLIALSKALNVPVDFFFAEPKVSVVLEHVDYRKKSSMSKTQQVAVELQCTEALNRYLTLELAMQDQKAVEDFVFGKPVCTPEDADEAAQQLRRDWDLGDDPIPNVVAMLEDKGYKVLELETDADFDGLKAHAGVARVIGMNKNIEDACRKRFTALHELAHHILLFPPDMPEREQERLCHCFAGAVLYPKEQALEAMHRERFHFYLPELVLLKEYWGISIAAIFARAKNLGIISEHVHTKLMIGYNTRKYRDGEPGNFRGDEKALRFRQLLYRGLAEEILSINQAATLSQKTVGELRNELDQLA
jgi:Zn-dependent peptidase ImmA (M78 family)/transcriptional regulator with XRE-family HTH domain